MKLCAAAAAAGTLRCCRHPGPAAAKAARCYPESGRKGGPALCLYLQIPCYGPCTTGAVGRKSWLHERAGAERAARSPASPVLQMIKHAVCAASHAGPWQLLKILSPCGSVYTSADTLSCLDFELSNPFVAHAAAPALDSACCARFDPGSCPLRLPVLLLSPSPPAAPFPAHRCMTASSLSARMWSQRTLSCPSSCCSLRSVKLN